MKVQVLSDNLMWTARLRQTLQAAGHEVIVSIEPVECDAAIVPLNIPNVVEVAQALRGSGAYVIGHAGHKEKEHLEKGHRSCDRVVTNGELAARAAKIIDDVPRT